MTRITCISDTHGHLPNLPGGDLLIIAGDLTARDWKDEYLEFNEWMFKQRYQKVVLIAGNHDGLLRAVGKRYFSVGQYLYDCNTRFEGLNIYGSPWTPTFGDWYFMKERGEDIREMWDRIPLDTDILITHGPPYGILDEVDGVNVGCEELRIAVERIKPRLHVFGHVHESYGTMRLKHEKSDTICVNASIMSERYNPVNMPITVEI